MSVDPAGSKVTSPYRGESRECPALATTLLNTTKRAAKSGGFDHTREAQLAWLTFEHGGHADNDDAAREAVLLGIEHACIRIAAHVSQWNTHERKRVER